MKKATPYIIIAALLVVIYLLSTCEGEKPEIITIEVPEKNGSFEPVKPDHQKIEKETIIKWRDREVKVANPVNQDLLKRFQAVEDSLTEKEAAYQRLLMFLAAIEIREYSQTFEDSLVKIDVFGKAQGEIQEMQANYTIKPTKVQAEQKQTVFRLLAGLEFGNNLQFNDFRYKANLGFQNAQGNILRGGYENLNNEDYIFVGYDFSIFSIKK